MRDGETGITPEVDPELGFESPTVAIQKTEMRSLNAIPER